MQRAVTRAGSCELAEHRRLEDSEHPTEIQHEMLIGAGFQLVAGRVAEGRTDELPQLRSEFAELMDLFEPVAA